jgi:hypothetical protein
VTCDRERRIEPLEQIEPCCSPECLELFFRAIDMLAQGAAPEAIGIELGSRLHTEVLREVERHRARRAWQDLLPLSWSC